MSRKLLLVALTGCAVVGSGSIASKNEAPEGANGSPTNVVAPAAAARPSLVVHEWGTFTSMQSSVGETLEGLHHEEERLPAFVYGRNGGAVPRSQASVDATADKGMETGAAAIHGVTQKLETPVLYFYSDEPVHANIDVKFPGGILSEWYPNARSYAPELGRWDRIADGRMEWDVDITPGLDGFPQVSPEDVWAPSRRVAATPIAVGDEREKFIFYRGLGAFEGPFRSKATSDGRFEFSNESEDDIPATFLLRVHEGGGAIVPLGPIARRGTLKGVASPTEGKELNLEAYVDDAKHVVKEALVASGLFADEAQAMVDTWSRSYFKSPGTRVLYIVPRSWTDRLLPLTMVPVPGTLVRTLVGRVEVLSPRDESEVVSQVESSRVAAASPEALIAKLGRFAEPKLRRACALVSQASASYCNNAVSLAAR